MLQPGIVGNTVGLGTTAFSYNLCTGPLPPPLPPSTTSVGLSAIRGSLMVGPSDGVALHQITVNIYVTAGHTWKYGRMKSRHISCRQPYFARNGPSTTSDRNSMYTTYY